MGNSRSSGRPSEKLAETEKALATVSRQRVEDLWSVCASDKLFITGAEALGFLEMLVQSLGVTMERETMQRLVAPFGDQVSHEDLHNLLFLAQDDLEEAEVAISDSLHRNFARLELPVRHVDLALLEQTELLHSTAGIATWRAHWREDGRAALLRVHSMSYLRRELDLHGVIEQMRRLHCQIALRYVGHSMEREDLVIIYEDPGSVHLLSSLLESGRWHAPPASVRKMFLRFAKGLLWLDTRKDLRHLQLRPDTVFVSTTGSTKLWCFVGEHLLKKRFDMVNLELLGGVVAYCSPEMLRGEGFDASPADVFALGLLMHATLTGREPFAGLEAADVMEQLLRGERPPLEGAGELAEVVAAAWRQDPAERASMAQLLEMLRRPLRSLRAGASMMGMPRRAPQSPPTQPQRRAHQSPPPRVQAPSSRSSELRQQLVASSPVAMQRLVPPLRHMPSPSVPVPVPVPAPALATLQGDSGGKASSRGSGGSSGKPRSASLSSSSYSPDEEERVPQRAVPVSLPAAPLYLYNGGMMPHVKVRCTMRFLRQPNSFFRQGTKMENAPAGELWYSLPLAPNSQVQFRVYPVLSTFEMRSLKQHWTKLWRFELLFFSRCSFSHTCHSAQPAGQCGGAAVRRSGDAAVCGRALDDGDAAGAGRGGGLARLFPGGAVRLHGRGSAQPAPAAREHARLAGSGLVCLGAPGAAHRAPHAGAGGL